MRPLTQTFFQFLAGLAGVVVLSAFLAPWVYHWMPFFKFDRILRRLIMVGALLLILGLLRARRGTLGELGLQRNAETFRLFAFGFLSGILLGFGLTLIQWALGARTGRIHETDLWHWIGLFSKGFGAGVLIGTIEEFFFRGFLFTMLKDLWNTRVSLGVTNLIYAMVHFFPKDKIILTAEPTVQDSFRILGAILPSFWQSPERILAVSGLFLFGLLLSLVFLQTKSLSPCMGIHAGAVFSLKMNRRFIPEISEKMGIFSGTKNLYDGFAGLALLLLLCIILGRKARLQNP